jgi:hypothetical protein
MAFEHGINARLVWTDHASEGNPTLQEALCHKIVLNMRRRMVEITPLSWNSTEWAPEHYRWTAEFHSYMQTDVDPGFFNDHVAAAQLKPNAAAVDIYSGSVWIEGLRVEASVDGPNLAVFLVRGTGNIAGAF